MKMFDSLPSLANITLKVQAPAKPTKTVTGQRLAKASSGYPWWVRAEDAARWLKGEVAIKPTAKLACAVFNVSYPRLKDAQERLDLNQHYFDEKHGNGNGTSAAALSDAVIENVVLEIGPDRILAALDRVTAPELPLQAAQ
jgi:hypothetical protein